MLSHLYNVYSRFLDRYTTGWSKAQPPNFSPPKIVLRNFKIYYLNQIPQNWIHCIMVITNCKTSYIERNKKGCIWGENFWLRFCPTCSAVLTNNTDEQKNSSQ